MNATESDREPGDRPRANGSTAAGPQLQIELSDTQGRLQVDPEALVALARDVLRGEGVERASISIVLVDDAAIHALNRRHLDHDWPTDVITFPLSEPGAEELAAELVVSAEMAATTAAAAGTDPHAELALYVVHGLLHLCGHDDRDESQARAMRQREDEVLTRAGLENPFAAAGRADAMPTTGGEEWR